MWKILALCLLAGAFPGLTQGRVVGNDEAGFAECNRFFYEQTPPEGFDLGQPSHLKICQKYKQEPRFATLYSTQDNTPLYCAFQYTEAAPSGEAQWLVEPQVDDPENGSEGMMPEAEVTGSVDNLGANQALTADYVDSGYERAQLNPSSLHKDDDQMATYTLTNAVPLSQPLQETWQWEVENLVSKAMAPQCENGKGLHLLAGVIPSTLKVKDKVSVPGHLWLAACCDDGSETWSVGFIKQVADENCLEDLTVEALEKKLPEGAKLFKNKCGQGRQNPKKREAVVHAAQDIRGKKPKKCCKNQQTTEKPKKPGFLKTLFNSIISPIITLVKFTVYLICQIVKYTFQFLWSMIKMIVKGMWTFIKGIFTVLMNIFIDLARVFVNILNDIAKNLYSVLMAVYKLICVPVKLLLDIISFPFIVLGAIPKVLRDIASGIGGMALLLINAITRMVTWLNSIVGHLAKRFLPQIYSNP